MGLVVVYLFFHFTVDEILRISKLFIFYYCLCVGYDHSILYFFLLSNIALPGVYVIKVRFNLKFLLRWKGKSQILLLLVPYDPVRF